MNPESFEDVYVQLQAAVAELERGGLSLEESVGKYEEGMRLAERCESILRAAELRLSHVADDPSEEEEDDD